MEGIHPPSTSATSSTSIPTAPTTSIPIVSTTNTPSVVAASLSRIQKQKRFRFTENYDLYLLKAVRSVDAHLPEWGKTEGLYDEVKTIILRAIPPTILAQSQQPSAKTFADRFKRLVSRHREDRKRTSAASGIIEKNGEKEQLLDDLILEMDEKDEAVRADKEEQTQQEMRLVAAGEEIRDLAMKRKANGDSESDLKKGTNGSAANSAKKRRKKEFVQSDDEIMASMLEQAPHRREWEKRRLDLDSERMEIERERPTRKMERFEKMQQSTNRRIDLDEKRFVVEVEERKQSLEERKKMLDVMELLCKKLQ